VNKYIGVVASRDEKGFLISLVSTRAEDDAAARTTISANMTEVDIICVSVYPVDEFEKLADRLVNGSPPAWGRISLN
jgi:hypothetical protein